MAIITPRYVFVHAPKTGGLAVSKALNGKPDQSVPMHLPRFALPQDRPAFGFLRNPWERMVSLYYFLLRSPDHHLPRVDPKEIRAMGFKKWLLEGKNWMSNEPQPDGLVYTRQAHRYGPDITYSGLEAVAANPDLPPQQRRPAMWYFQGCAFIGKTENLGRDLKEALILCGAEPVSLKIVNKTPGKPKAWWKEYDDETIAHVAHYFAPDIEQGGYKPPWS